MFYSLEVIVFENLQTKILSSAFRRVKDQSNILYA